MQTGGSHLWYVCILEIFILCILLVKKRVIKWPSSDPPSPNQLCFAFTASIPHRTRVVAKTKICLPSISIWLPSRSIKRAHGSQTSYRGACNANLFIYRASCVNALALIIVEGRNDHCGSAKKVSKIETWSDELGCTYALILFDEEEEIFGTRRLFLLPTSGARKPR